MLRESFLNRRTRYREQTIGQVAKGLILFRRTRHIASMIAPLLALTSAILLAQSQPPAPTSGPQRQEQQGKPTNQTAKPADKNATTHTSPADANQSKSVGSTPEGPTDGRQTPEKTADEWWWAFGPPIASAMAA